MTTRRTPRRRRGDAGLLAAAVSLLAAVALAIAVAVAWPNLTGQGTGQVARRQDRDPAAAAPPIVERPRPAPGLPRSTGPDSAGRRGHAGGDAGRTDLEDRPSPASVAPPTGGTIGERAHEVAEPSSAADAGARRAETMAQEPAAASARAAEERGEREAQERARVEAAAVVERSLRATLSALRAGDLAAARRGVDAASAAAGDDADLSARSERWRLLVAYANDLETHRRQASESAAKGREYEIGGRTIGIVELTPRSFAYKEAGRVVRGSRSELPKPIERAILRDWFAADGRAANFIFLGVDRLLDREPDLGRVREDWDTALRGEPATRPLMPLLDDPLITGR